MSINIMAGQSSNSNKFAFANLRSSSPVGAKDNDDAADIPDLDLDDESERERKCNRESLDSISSMSVESFALRSSTKKQKLSRTGTITRTIKHSMSFVAEREPIAKRLRSRRSSVALDSAPQDHDNTFSSLYDDTENVNDSLHSMTSVETTFNESICKPVKNKLCSLTNRITRSSSRREKSLINSNQPNVVAADTTTDVIDCQNEKDKFKIPKAPLKSASKCKSAPRPTTRSLSTLLATSSVTSSTSNGCNTLFSNTNIITALPQSNQTLEKSNHSPSHQHQLSNHEQPQQLANQSINNMDSGCPKLASSAVIPPNATSDEFKSRVSGKSGQIQTGTLLGSTKRRQSVSDAGLLSAPGSFFDCTTSPEKLENAKLLTELETSKCEQTPIKKASKRFNLFMELYNTESNYVGILDAIINLFKNPLEEFAERNDALINKSEIRAIFGNFIPIHEVHQRMLKCLRSLHSNWSEDCLIGSIILLYHDDLIKAYRPYVNFFERMKETLIRCDKQNPRFHGFLIINQTKPECGHQTLENLMIRPVQRLPIISLLLNGILKHTNKSNPDYVRLEEALKVMKEVLMHINEEKRKTESRMAIFDIFNDIEGCPPHLVSSTCSFISRCEVTELTDDLSGRGDNLTMYLFSDTIEVHKKRSNGLNTAKSSSTAKCYKHIKLISLNAIRSVINITDSPRAFALLFRQDNDMSLHAFTISDEEIDKVVYLKNLWKQIAENGSRTETDKAMLCHYLCRTSQQLEVDISDVNVNTRSKAFKLAARTRSKVGRAFSFNKTPSKLKPAVSTMMTSPSGSTNSLTRASQSPQIRFASCTNIHEVGDDESSDMRISSSTHSEVLMPPL